MKYWHWIIQVNLYEISNITKVENMLYASQLSITKRIKTKVALKG